MVFDQGGKEKYPRKVKWRISETEKVNGRSSFKCRAKNVRGIRISRDGWSEILESRNDDSIRTKMKILTKRNVEGRQCWGGVLKSTLTSWPKIH